ncbi:MAG: hypothetical protein JNL89_05430 [Rhodanobacteraceae bacterium]|nr:hypothetical protein [Rhodanobacteraceae bacterium]
MTGFQRVKAQQVSVTVIGQCGIRHRNQKPLVGKQHQIQSAGIGRRHGQYASPHGRAVLEPREPRLPRSERWHENVADVENRTVGGDAQHLTATRTRLIAAPDDLAVVADLGQPVRRSGQQESIALGVDRRVVRRIGDERIEIDIKVGA